MESAFELKEKEIIYKEATEKFLWALNIHNTDAAYRTQY